MIMNWILPYIFSLLAFLGTLYFIRIVGKIVRQMFPKSQTIEWDNLKITIVRSMPSIALGILLLILRNQFGWIWISSGAIWVSLIWDGLHFISVLYYIGKLRRLRRNPDSFFYQVKVEPYDDWANTNLPNIFPVKFWMRGISLPTLLQPFSFMLTLFGSGKTPLGILHGDFRRFLRNDFRYIDVVDDIEGKLGFSEKELWSVPHLAVKNKEAYRREILGFLGILGDIVKAAIKDEAKKQKNKNDKQTLNDVLKAISPDENESKFSKQASRSSSKFFLTNRAVNSALPIELWETSCRLCQTTPSIIAATWKLYHFQEDVRLRLVTLFNAADLMQRLIGAMILRMLEETGELNSLVKHPDFPRDSKKNKPIFPPNTNGDWNRVLQWTLKNSKSEELKIFRQILIKPNPNFAANVEKLTPFWQILQIKPQIPEAEQNTLANFSILEHLRNKTVGHGSIGWKLQLRPAVYLSALHHFFLAAMQDISKLDLGVLAYRQVDGNLEVVSAVRGLWTTGIVKDDCRAAVENPVTGKLLGLSPYLRFHNGRLLIVDRFSKDHSQAAYIDYNAENIAEPSFVNLEIGSSENLSNTFV